MNVLESCASKNTRNQFNPNKSEGWLKIKEYNMYYCLAHVRQIDFKVQNMQELRIWNSSIRMYRGKPLIWSMCTGTFYRCINCPNTYTCTCLRKRTFRRSLVWVYDTLRKLDAIIHYIYID
ncbi:hypothetical protein CAJAP_04156 [Camponotus japonicus]